MNSNTLDAHLAAIFLIPMVATAGGLMYSLLAANIAGYTKKTVTGTLFFSAYCVANIIPPQTSLASQSPTYTTWSLCDTSRLHHQRNPLLSTIHRLLS